MTFQLRTEHIPFKKNQKTKLKKLTLFCCSYNPHESMITYQLQEIGIWKLEIGNWNFPPQIMRKYC